MNPKINIINKQNLILESKQMQKILVITMNEDYPFFIPRPDEQTHNNPTLVRRIIQTNECNHHHILGKTTFIKNLRNKNLVKAQDIIDKGEAVYVLYENVQSKFDWRDPQIITDVYGQLKNLTTYLANIGVKTFLQSNRIGITETGNLKYYLGVDFQFTTEKDDQFLPAFYQNQLSKLFGYEFTKNNSNNNINISMQTSKLNSQRKGSFATIPSRQSRMAHIQKQMNLIKSSYEKRQSKRKQFTVGDQQNKKMIYSQNSEVKLNRVLVIRDKSKLAKKWEDRKFSGDIRNNMMSGKRLEQKQSDIKSQRSAYAPTNKLRQRERYLRDNNQEEIQTVNSRSKSRIQQMKYQQYIQIKKSEKNYLQDFISVLEDEQTNLQNILSSNTSRITRPTETSIKFDDSNMNSTQALRIKTRQAILNSRKVINKVKGIPSKGSLNQ